MAEARLYVNEADATFPMFMSGEEASRFLGVSYPTFKKMAEAGDVTATKKNDRWQVNTKSVLTYLGLEYKVVSHDG